MFKPKLVGFLCNWCSYAGADLAGIGRIQMMPNLRIIRVMCSGSLDPELIFEALLFGADGVIVMGCHPGDCHYISGNLQAERKIELTKKLLELTDLENGRLRLEWVSAAEGGRFAEVVNDFTDQIQKLGPSPIKTGDETSKNLVNQLQGAKLASTKFRLRSVVSRQKQLVEEGNVYGEKISQEEMDKIFDEMINDEYIRNRILLKVETEPSTVEEISEEIDIPTEDVFKHVARLWKRQIILMEGHKGDSPIFIKAEGGA
jgi:coenzyme F420-reducing hydrogenase delta subunit